MQESRPTALWRSHALLCSPAVRFLAAAAHPSIHSLTQPRTHSLIWLANGTLLLHVR